MLLSIKLAQLKSLRVVFKLQNVLFLKKSVHKFSLSGTTLNRHHLLSRQKHCQSEQSISLAHAEETNPTYGGHA